jgi:hypothetical protein
LRGVVAGVFGAIKTRLAGGYLQEVLPSMAQKRAYLEATAYNLRLVLRLLLHLLLPGPPSIPPSASTAICKTSSPTLDRPPAACYIGGQTEYGVSRVPARA